MKIFIVAQVKNLTDCEHSKGGFVIIASDLQEAKERAAGFAIEVTDEEWGEAEVYDLKNEVDGKYWVFPNAGCC